MANKFVDQNGLLYFWQKLLAKFQQKESGKGLSTNDYTTDEKNKLAGLKNTTIIDNLTSESADAALSAKQGKLLNDSIAKITTDIGELGGGDMMKALYDKDNDGKVDTANDAEKLGGKLPSAYAEAGHIHDNATTEKDGFISKEDKAKLDGIEEGANKYTLPSATATALGGIKVGENLSITEDGVLSADAQHIDVDDALNAESVNPVQNKIVNAALNERVNTAVLGQANGVATLDESGLIPSSQLPSYVDDVIEGYADVTVNTTTDDSGYTTTTTVINGFYSDEAHKNAITGESGKIYVDVATNLSYRWGGTVYVQITSTDCTAVTNAEIDAIVATTV